MNPRIALVHDWLEVYTGSERCLEQMLLLYPQADLFAVVDFIPPEKRGFLQSKPVQTTYIQRLPFARRKFRSYLALMPLAIEQLDLSQYDLVISSCHAVAKGVLTGPDQLHLSYIYSPLRYAWEMQHEYLRDAGLNRGFKSLAARLTLHYMRLWDLRAAQNVDTMAAISHFIARRIQKTYRRKAETIYPPVDTSYFHPGDRKEDFYLTASRLVEYKKVDLIVKAFTDMPERRLVVIGDGPAAANLKTIATPNITFLGHQPAESLRSYMQSARAFIFAGCEDFGIAPLEAQACGTPVIAFGQGGLAETIMGLEQQDPSGLFFQDQSAPAIRMAVEQFEQQSGMIIPLACRSNAERFSIQSFRAAFSSFVERGWQAFQSGRRTFNGGEVR